MGFAGGGRDRLDLAPLDPEGNVITDEPDLDNMVGCHTGAYLGLCVLNPQPGRVYVWERNKGADLLRARQNGGRIVGPEDPELAAMNKVVGDATPIDSADVFKDVILVSYPEESVRRRREQEQARARAMMRGGAEDFVSRATAAELEASGGRPTRFRRADHRLDYINSEGQTVDQWAPDRGIVDEG